MDTEDYLKEILKGQNLEPEQLKALQSTRAEVEELLTEAFVDCHPTIRYAGSKVKGTMNKISYDLDIVCYFPHDETSAGETLKDIYENVQNFLADSYIVEPRNSAIRIKSKEPDTYGKYFHIDVVPGRFVDDSGSFDVFLYQNLGEKSRLKTNLDLHIEHIKESGLVPIIRLAKLWKTKYGLPIRTFVLELLVVKYAEQIEDKPLTNGIKTFWEKIKNREYLSIEDPANPDGNDLSPLFDDNTKGLIKEYSTMALDTIEQDNWKQIFGEPEEMSDEEKKAAIISVAASTINAPRPWAYEKEEDMVSK